MRLLHVTDTRNVFCQLTLSDETFSVLYNFYVAVSYVFMLFMRVGLRMLPTDYEIFQNWWTYKQDSRVF